MYIWVFVDTIKVSKFLDDIFYFQEKSHEKDNDKELGTGAGIIAYNPRYRRLLER